MLFLGLFGLVGFVGLFAYFPPNNCLPFSMSSTTT